jgi:hypothetical protein
MIKVVYSVNICYLCFPEVYSTDNIRSNLCLLDISRSLCKLLSKQATKSNTVKIMPTLEI